jgi:transposase
MQLIKDKITKNDILKVINQNKRITIKELANHFDIGYSSIQKLLKLYNIQGYKVLPKKIRKIDIFKYLNNQNEKITVKKFANYFNIPTSSAITLIKKYNIVKDFFRRYEVSKSEKMRVEVIRNFNIGLSRQEIAKTLNLSQTIQNRCHLSKRIPFVSHIDFPCLQAVH